MFISSNVAVCSTVCFSTSQPAYRLPATTQYTHCAVWAAVSVRLSLDTVGTWYAYGAPAGGGTACTMSDSTPDW